MGMPSFLVGGKKKTSTPATGILAVKQGQATTFGATPPVLAPGPTNAAAATTPPPIPKTGDAGFVAINAARRQRQIAAGGTAKAPKAPAAPIVPTPKKLTAGTPAFGIY